MDHPNTRFIDQVTLGVGGTASGARTRLLEIGKSLAATDEVRRLYLEVNGATLTAVGAPGRTDFKASQAELDGMWSALFSSINLIAMTGCEPIIPDLSGSTLAQLIRGNGYEGQKFDVIPPPNRAVTLAVADTFPIGDLRFEIPFVNDEVDSLRSFSAGQAWVFTEGNGLTLTVGSLQFVADGTTWTFGATVSLVIRIERRPNPFKMGRPITSYRAVTVGTADNTSVSTFGPALFVGIIDRSPASFTDTFDLSMGDSESACDPDLLRAQDWRWALRAAEYDRDMSRGPDYRSILAAREDGFSTTGLAPAPLFWLAPDASPIRVADINGSLLFRRINAADLAAGFNVGVVYLQSVKSSYRSSSPVPPPAPALMDMASMPKLFQSGPFAAYRI